MKDIILIDAELKSTYDQIQQNLANKIEFMFRNSASKDEKIIKYLQDNCNPRKLYELQVKLMEIEKKWNRGVIRQ